MSNHDALSLLHALQHPNVQAFLRMLRHGEGTSGPDGYRTVFGGGLLDDLAQHPNKPITRKLGGTPITSTAAGAYQFLARTWAGLVAQYGFADFGPMNQDLGAVALIAGRKALDDVIAGRFAQAVEKCNREWASLPGSPYGQPVVTMARARREYEAHGGQYTDPLADAAAAAVWEPVLAAEAVAEAGAAPAPAMPAAGEFSQGAEVAAQAVEREQPRAVAGGVADGVDAGVAVVFEPSTLENEMTPFLAAVLPSLIDLVPKLGTVFASGSATSQRNVQAAQMVVDAAKAAVGAANEQELAEKIRANPQAAAQAKQAIEAAWYQISEVGGGVEAAREANVRASEPGAAPVWRQPAFVMSALLLPLVYLVAWMVLTGSKEAFSAEVKSMVVAAIISGVLSALTGYWLGTSFSSQRKTELQAGARAG